MAWQFFNSDGTLKAGTVETNHGTSKHTEGTAWRVTYQNASGDDVELILGADGTFFQSNGASAAPTFAALVQADIPGHGAGEHTEHGNWKVVYTDASGDETELALGADGTFLQANGAAAAPTFAALVQADIAGHGIAQHTEHANWKVLYTDGSGDEQELALGADGTFLQSGGASTLPEFTALVDGDIPATHSGTAHHAAESSATTSAEGIAELATIAETDTGTDTGRVITPDALAGSVHGIVRVAFVIGDKDTALATGDGQAVLHIPASMNGMNLITVHAEAMVAGTTGTMDIQLSNEDGGPADMLSTKLTIDSGETGSDTAATPAVISGTEDDVATNNRIEVDIDAVQTTPAKGLVITLEFQFP